MTGPRLGVVLNAQAGASGEDTDVDRVAELFRLAGVEARIAVADSGEEILRAARRLAGDGCAALVAGGGDGTVSAVAGVAVEHRLPLGILPLGTLNHFAKDAGLPLELEAAARAIAEGRSRAVDVGEVNGRLFLNNASLGVYPRIVRLRQRYGGGGLSKWIAALWATLTVLRRRPFLAVRIVTPGEVAVRRTPFVLVGNNEYQMAGLHAASRPSLAGGRLAVYVLNASRRTSLLGLAWRLFWRGADEVRELDLLPVEEALVETRRDRFQVALDGEVVTLAAPLRFRIRPGALRLLAPAESAAAGDPPRP